MIKCLIQTLEDTTGIAPAQKGLLDHKRNFNQIRYIVLRGIRVLSDKLRKPWVDMVYQSSSSKG